MARIVILTGAGISAESGLGTFRDKDGLWTRYDLQEVATPQGFRRNPALVHEFHNARRANCAAASPNDAHKALARLEKALPGQVLLVTQNVDDLHQRAGSANVIQMHGALMRATCHACRHTWPAPTEMHPADPCPACGRAETRPDVVWFGEIPYALDTIADKRHALNRVEELLPIFECSRHKRRDDVDPYGARLSDKLPDLVDAHHFCRTYRLALQLG